jgi:hypothetical protein
MIRTKTVFVVGAGASVEASLTPGQFPAGKGLCSAISRLTAPGSVGWVNDPKFDQAINAYLTSLSAPGHLPVREELLRLSEAIHIAPSIDNYLHSNFHNPIAVMIGKLGIAHTIAECERGSKLKPVKQKPLKQGGIDTALLSETWYARLAELLVEGVTLDNLETIFDNVSFIIFNYDRCVEHFLWHMLRLYFGISEASADKLMERLDVVHPYGSLGPLHSQVGGAKSFGFGEPADGYSIFEMAKNIRTFTEERGNEKIQEEVRKLMAESHLMVFVGFGFIDLNMKLLRPVVKSEARCIAGTCFAVSADNRTHILPNIATSYQHNNIGSAVKLADPKLTANSFFIDYGMTLRSNC